MVEVIAEGVLHQAAGLGRGEPLLGLPLELRVAQEDREQRAGAARHVVRSELGSALVAHERAVALEPAHESGPHPSLVAAALAGRHRVAVGGDEAFLVIRPGQRPLDAPGVAVERALACEECRRQRVALAEGGAQIIGQTARIVEDRRLWHCTGIGEQHRILPGIDGIAKRVPALLQPHVGHALLLDPGEQQKLAHPRGAERHPAAGPARSPCARCSARDPCLRRAASSRIRTHSLAVAITVCCLRRSAGRRLMRAPRGRCNTA